MSFGWDLTTAYGCTTSLGGRRAHVDNNGAAGGQGGILATIGKSTGKWYLEMGLVTVDSTPTGMAVGFSDQHGVLQFLNGVAVGYNSTAYYINDTEGSAYGATGTLVVASSVVISAGTRVGLKLNLDDGWVDIISALSPEGTHNIGGTGGHDPYVFPHFGGNTVYPMVCTAFGNGADHAWDVDLYGREADFTITRDAAFLAIDPTTAGPAFFSLL